MRNIHTSQLRLNDKVVKLNDKDEIIDAVTLKSEIPTLGCNGRHFVTVANTLVCYGPGIVTVLGN